MPFRCFSCGLSFDTVEEFVEHKLVPQEQPERGMILRGDKPVPASSSKPNYRGDMLCPNCGQTIKVVIQNGEVIFAASNM